MLWRVEWRPVENPRQKGELADSAIRSGICGRSRRSSLDRRLRIGYADVDVQPEDQLAAGGVLQLLDDPAGSARDR